MYRFALLLIATAALTACGSGAAEAESPTASPVSSSSVAPSSASAGKFPKTVEHALGSTEIPAAPQRIVVLNQYSLLDYLVALGLPPVASTGDPAADYPFASYLGGQTEGVEMVGGTEELNLERIAALTPDLILSNPWQEDIYAELLEIAPTIGVPLTYRDYLGEFRWVAELVGREGRAEELIADHQARLAAVRQTLGDRADELAVTVVRVFPDTARVEGASYVTDLLRSTGFTLSGIHADPKGTELSLERIPELDADAIVVYSAANAELEDDNAAARDAWFASPLWENLAAAQAGQVYLVDSFLWAGGGFVWAEAMLDDLERILRTEDPQPLD